MKKVISITTGDPDGIGLEVGVKALLELGPTRKTQYLFWHHNSVKSPLLKLGKKFKCSVLNEDQVFRGLELSPMDDVFFISSSKDPAQWVEQSAKWALNGQIQGLVTGPMSKRKSRNDGAVGHNEILRRVSGRTQSYMGFYGPELQVVLATGHIPLSQVSKSIDKSTLQGAIKAALQFRKILSGRRSTLPIGVLGLNPHAGEQGLIGKEERKISSLLKSLERMGFPVLGPLVPDVAFQDSFRKRYSVLVALYHDQGLIPFKLLHGTQTGAQISLGLPLVRTSVDHGTAKDIFGKNRAEPGSMYLALRLCHKLIDNS